MKFLRLILISVSVILVLDSCKKEVPPEIEITVVDTLRNRVENAFVEISVDGAQGGIIDSTVVGIHRTDEFGKAFFKFKHTVLVDVILYNRFERIDSTSILAETKRKKGRNAKNIYERTLIFK